jgi:hypothetical protein
LSDPGSLHAVSTTADTVAVVDGKLYALAASSGEYTAVLSSGERVAGSIDCPEAFTLDRWDIGIEDWNEGERIVNTEEKFGHVTTEVYYTTRKTKLAFQNSELLPWKELVATGEQLAVLAGDNPSMAHVSGIGVYETSFALPEEWGNAGGAYLQMESAGGGLSRCMSTVRKRPGVNTRTLRVEIGGLLKPGGNSIRIEVASTLTNRMLQRGYREKASGWTDVFPAVQAYGLRGDVRIIPYGVVPLT